MWYLDQRSLINAVARFAPKPVSQSWREKARKERKESHRYARLMLLERRKRRERAGKSRKASTRVKLANAQQERSSAHGERKSGLHGQRSGIIKGGSFRRFIVVGRRIVQALVVLLCIQVIDGIPSYATRRATVQASSGDILQRDYRSWLMLIKE